MKRNSIIILTLAIIIFVSIFSWVLINKEAKNENGLINEGAYFDDNQNLLGKCIKEEVLSQDGYGVWTYDTFYDNKGNLAGSCSSYSGPGSSGWKGGCDENAVQNGIGTKIESDDPGYTERVSQKYFCIIN